MKVLLLILLLICFGVATVLAQPMFHPLKREFMDSTFRVQPDEAGAHYRRETEYADSLGGTVKTYFLATGKLQGLQSFANIQKGIMEGLLETWFANGQLHSHEEFKRGKQVGELRTYYSNGQLKRREIFDNQDDFASSGECFRADGRPVPFFKYEQMPTYPEGDGGNHVIVAAIQHGVKYPRDALKARRGGRVIVSFNVTSLGEVADIKIVKGVYPSIDAAVIKAVQQLKRFKPGMQDGLPVTVAFTVPITFTIN